MRQALLAFSGACVVLAVAVYLVAFDTARGIAWDANIFQAATAQGDIPRIRAASSTLIHTIDIGSLVLLGGGIVVVALLRRDRRAALAAALLIGGANATTQILKPVLGDLHPFGRAGRGLGGSFPSGHSTVAMSIALAAVLVAPQSWKFVVALAGAAYATAVGVSLLVQASHYPSDVAGAFLVTGAWAGLVTALVPSEPADTRPESLRAGLLAAGAAIVAFVIAVVVAVITHPGIVTRIRLQTKLVFAVVVLAALALAIGVGLALLLQARALRSAAKTRA
jgi:membrane-associated phospholipid phosphatase